MSELCSICYGENSLFKLDCKCSNKYCQSCFQRWYKGKGRKFHCLYCFSSFTASDFEKLGIKPGPDDLIKEGDLKLFKELYGDPSSIIQLKSIFFIPRYGIFTSIDYLNLAVYYGKLDFVKFLYESGLEYNSKALEIAIEMGHLDIVKYFLRDINVETTVEKSNLHLACRCGHLRIVEYLIEEMEIKPDEKCLYNALRGDNVLLVQKLIDLNIRPNHRAIQMVLYKNDSSMFHYLYSRQYINISNIVSSLFFCL